MENIVLTFVGSKWTISPIVQTCEGVPEEMKSGGQTGITGRREKGTVTSVVHKTIGEIGKVS